MELKQFIKDTSVLFIFILLSRVLGMFFRIPFDYFFGIKALGLYDIAFPIYSILFALSTVGFVSSIANNMAVAKEKEEKYTIFKLESNYLLMIGILLSFLILIFKNPAVDYFGLPKSILYSLNVVVVLPIIIVLISRYRGFFQSIHRSKITGISIIIEQSARTILGLLFAYVLKINNYSIGIIVSGAYLGIIVGSMLSLSYLFYHYKSISKVYWQATQQLSRDQISLKPIFFSIGTYVIIGLFLIIITFIDVLTIPRYLNLLNFNEETILTLMGMRARALTIANIPLIISSVVIMNLIPNAAQHIADVEKFKDVIKKVLEFSIYLLMPAIVGIFVLSEELLSLFFNATLGTHYLRLMIFKILFIVMIQIIINVINVINDYGFIIKSFVVVVFLKIILNYWLVFKYELLIDGAIIASIIIFGLFLSVLFYYLKKKIALNLLQVKRVYYAVAFSLIMWVSLYSLKRFVLFNVSSIILITVSMLIGSTIYMGLLYLVDKKYIEGVFK